MKSKKQKAIQELLKLNIKNHDQLTAVKRKMSKKYGIDILLNSEILTYVQTQHAASPKLQRLLRKRSIRTLSGIAPVAVLTKSYPCPGKCAYCPTEKDVPQSYLSNEPAVMRAIRCNYNPYKQVQLRLRALEANGHKPTKIEIIVIGGTWSVLPKKYKYHFISECFRAANDYPRSVILEQSPGRNRGGAIEFQGANLQALHSQLNKQQKKNEQTKYRIIGLTLETRPDYINDKELQQMRELGCTRVEFGVQAINDKILKINKRGHDVETITKATKLLKNYGFKVTYHIMPGLPGSTAKKDFQMFQQLFSDKRFQPDQIKFYPTVVTKDSLLYKWWKRGKYKPYTDIVLQNLIIKCKNIIPKYVRIIRLIRDIPSESIIAGNRITNLRQIMKDKGVKCKCIRCREPRAKQIKNPQLSIIKYPASGGQDYFLSYESKDKKTLYGFCRLRLPFIQKEAEFPIESSASTSKNNRDNRYPLREFIILKDAALIRELHVYGELVPVGGRRKVQHAGLGKKLMREAENIAKKNSYKKIAVIAGVGTRQYYRQLGYRLKNTYMVKNLSQQNLT